MFIMDESYIRKISFIYLRVHEFIYIRKRKEEEILFMDNFLVIVIIRYNIHEFASSYILRVEIIDYACK